jgi:hypothetical protein
MNDYLKTMPLDADEPILGQLEEELMNAPDEEGFRQGLAWLTKKIYPKLIPNSPLKRPSHKK